VLLTTARKTNQRAGSLRDGDRTGIGYLEDFDYGDLVGSIQTDSFDEDPGVFTYQGNYVVAFRFPDYSLVGPNNPAFPGDFLVVYTTGLGPL
jgi:hypothetical protein